MKQSSPKECVSPLKVFYLFKLQVNPDKGIVRVKNHRIRLPFEEGFWNNNPTIHNGKIYSLQNINDPQDELTAIAD